jgi:Mg2+/Co2+ transporter CorB
MMNEGLLTTVWRSTVHLTLATFLLILLFIIFLSAFFSCSEISIMSLNRYRLRYLVKKNNKQAIRVSKMLERPDKLLGFVLIGNTLANILASTIATLVGQHLYGHLGVAIATTLLTLIILVFAEITPKTLAALYPQRIAFAVSLPLKILQTLFAPLVQSVSWITKMILSLFNIRIDAVQEDILSGEELRSVVHEAAGLLPVEHKNMLLSLLDLEQATVEDIMIPKAEIIGLDLEQTPHELLEELETIPYNRLPLYRHSIDNLVGIVHVRQLLNLAIEERLDTENLLKIAEAAYFIPEETPLNVQILNFRKMKKQSCFVVDEYGDLQGLVTLEDILEEAVGEFISDISEMSKEISQQQDGSVIVDATITLRHLKRLLNWQLPMIGPRTLSGLIIEHLGYIPSPDSCLKIENFQIEILRVSDNMVKAVRMLKVR